MRRRSAAKSPTAVPDGDDAALTRRLRDARLEALLTGHPSKTRASAGATTLDQLIMRTAEVYARSLTDHTRESYASRWRRFTAWAEDQGQTALPASPETVMLYLAYAVDQQPPASLSTLRGRLAAINRVHVEAGYPPPGDDPAMGMLMRGLGRVVGHAVAPQPISALRIGELRLALAAMHDLDPRVVRDRAILSLTAAGLAAEDLSHLLWQDVHVRARDVALRLRDHPRDTPSRHRHVRATQDTALCPRQAVLAWRGVAGDDPRHVFTLVDGTGRRDPRPIHAYNIRRIVATRLDSLGNAEGPATIDSALRLMTGVPSVVLRDRALLLVGFAGAFRRNELCNLRWADVRDEDGGIVLRLRRSKTDPAGRGRDVGVPLGRSDLTCPVTALRDWRERVQSQLAGQWQDEFPVLARVGRAGRIGTDGISPAALTRIVKGRADAAALAGHWGGRSLRAGFITTAADLEIPLEEIARQSRHASLDNLVRYIRADDPFRRNAASWVGL